MYEGKTDRELALRYVYLIGWLAASEDGERLAERLTDAAMWASTASGEIAQDILDARARDQAQRAEWGVERMFEMLEDAMNKPRSGKEAA
jgi:isocitrate lyase